MAWIVLVLVALGVLLPEPSNGGAPEEILRLRTSSRGQPHCHQADQGFVTIARMGTEGHICRTGWSLPAAHVVCRQLGYRSALELDERCVQGARLVHPNRRYWLSNVRCAGNETSIAHCQHDGWGIHDCLPEQAVMVHCSNRPMPDADVESPLPSRSQCSSRRITGVRLYASRGIKNILEEPGSGGYVQVRVCNEWKAVCGDGWTSSFAGHIVCRQLGYERVSRVFTGRAPSADRRREAWLMQPRCMGRESFLGQCTYRGRLERQTCRLRRIAGVICKPSSWTRGTDGSAATVIKRPAVSGDVRLRGGAYTSEGRVEIFHDGEWGVVCDSGWSLIQANVVCRQLGLGSAYEAPHAASRVFGRGYSRVHLDDVLCTGFEGRLRDCRHAAWGQSRCDRERIASVRCHAPRTSHNRQQIRLEEIDDAVHVPAARRRGLVQVKVGDRWGPICADDNWDLEAGQVACRQLGYEYVYSVFTTSAGCPTAAPTNATAVKPTEQAKNDLGDIIPADELLVDSDGGLEPAPTAPPVTSSSEPESEGLVAGLRCNGHELSLDQCAHTHYNAKGTVCSSCKYAGLQCTAALPDLIPDLHELEHSLHDIEYRTLSALQCAYEEGCLSTSARAIQEQGHAGSYYRALLRFTVRIHNFGLEDFRPVRSSHSWIWHACHHHYHSFDNFATYNLLDHNTSAPVAEGHKASFCLEDTECLEQAQPYYSCRDHRQGISLRCSDIYGRALDCQWIDITDVADGTYRLHIQTNPNRLAAELDYTNNIAECSITLRSGSYRDYYEAGTVTNVTCIGANLVEPVTTYN